MPHKPPLNAVLFDMDGVLVDSRVAMARSLNHALCEQGLEPEDPSALHPWIGAPLAEIFAALLEARGADHTLVETCILNYRERYARTSTVETLLLDGVAPMLAALRAQYRLGVATTRPARYARPILEALGVDDAFGAICGTPHGTLGGVPKATIVGRALAELGLGPTPPDGAPIAAMIGDRRFDVEGGRANGLVTIGVTWGIGSERELREAGADHIVASPEHLTQLLLDA